MGDPPGPPTLRIASFNIRNGLALDGTNAWLLRRRAAAEAIRALDADVVGLQEVYAFALRSLLRSLGPHESVSAGRADGRRRGEACPILVRPGPWRLVDSWTRWFSGEPERPGTKLPKANFPRLVTVAVLAGPKDREIRVANTHLDERHATNRILSAKLLAEWLPTDRPTVIVGDLNAPPDADEVAHLLAAGYRSALPHEPAGTSPGFRGREESPQIDHILVSPQWEVLDAQVRRERVRGRMPSDHWPIVAELGLRHETPTPDIDPEARR